MNPRECVLDAIHHRQPAAVPYTLGFEDGVDEELDVYYGSPAWRDRLVRYMVDVAAVDEDMKVPLDDVRWRDGYGAIWRHDRRPWHIERPPLDQPSFDGYAFPSPDLFYRPQWKEEARRTIAEHGDAFIVGNLGWGLFERSWTLRGFENVLVDFVTEPDFVAEALDRLVDLFLHLIEYTADLPVDGLLFGDDWGDQRGVIIGARRWRQFLKPRWARLYEAAHRYGKIVMHHSCGSVAEILPDIIEIGVDVLESVQPEAAGMNPYELKRKWGDKITFWGCLGSQSTIPFGTPEGIKAEVRRLRSEMGRGGGYILAPAKALQPGTPVENAAAVVEAFASSTT
jgi:uroporphyrinogen decarboxylase